MRAIDRAEDVMRGADVGDPVAHGFVDGFLERLLAGVDRHDFRAEHFHAIDVQRLPLAIHRAHVDDAFQAEHGGDGGGGDAVLARAGLGDDARLAHAPGEQDLADAVVDLVRAGVEQVLALEINLRAAEFAREPFGEIKRRGPAAEFLEVILELALELRVVLRAEVFVLQFLQRVHQRFRHKTSAVGAEMALGVGQIWRWQLNSCRQFSRKGAKTQRNLFNHGWTRINTDWNSQTFGGCSPRLANHSRR